MNEYNLEKQTENILKDNKWEIKSHLHYEDPSTKKDREKDIIATSFELEREDILQYYCRLFIECKYLPKETVICLEDINMDEIEKTILSYNMPSMEISEIERYKKLHFYEYTKVLMHKDSGDFFYKPINQSLQSFNAFRKATNEKAIYYLLVVYDGNLKFQDKNGNKKDCNNILFWMRTLGSLYDLPNNECFIELVSIDQLENFLKKIREDIGKINSIIYFYYKKEKDKIDENRRRVKNEKNDYGL